MEDNWIAIPFDAENIRERALTRFCKKVKELIKKFIMRIIELLVSIIGIIFLIPFSLVVMFQNAKNGDYKNIFKTEERLGKNGKIFKMFRFRGTEGSEFEKNLKSTCLDELPQFINVFLGQMALVGPRPYAPDEKEEMGNYYSRISQIKPGLTGVYQISGREKMTLLDRLDMDTRYYYNKGFWLDFKILAITAVVTLKRKHTINYVDYTYTTIKDAITVAIKKIIDIIGALVGIVILIPLTAVVATINFISGDHGPIFYAQERIGRYGKHFKMYKFRSMVVDADAKLETLLENDEDARKEYKEFKKLKKDPRVTKIGNFLRKTSLDEFPQFINVLKGEMSLVGPRAYLPREKEDMKDAYDIIIKCKPGITGLWQVSGRNDTSFEERLNIDIEYYSKNSLFFDIDILFKTITTVLKKEGAS